MNKMIKQWKHKKNIKKGNEEMENKTTKMKKKTKGELKGNQ